MARVVLGIVLTCWMLFVLFAERRADLPGVDDQFRHECALPLSPLQRLPQPDAHRL